MNLKYTIQLHESLLHIDELIRESLLERDLEKMRASILKLEEHTQMLENEDMYTTYWRNKLAQHWIEFCEIQSEGFNGKFVNKKIEYRLTNEKPLYILRKPSDQDKIDPIMLVVEKIYRNCPSIKNMSDFFSMKQFLSSTIRVFRFVPPQMDDPDLQRKVFFLAFKKLPPAGRDMFSAMYEVESLYMVFAFIRIEVENYSENNRHLNPNEGISVLEINRKENQSRDFNGNVICPCKNCQQEGHTIKFCPTLKLSFCLNCYK